MWNVHHTVFGSKRCVICALAVYFLHSTRPSVTWLNSRSTLAACDWYPVYTIQPVVKPVIQPVWQPLGCLFTRCSRLSNRLYNWTAGCTTGLTTGWMFYTQYNLPVWQQVMSCKRGLTDVSVICRAVNPRPTSQKTWRRFLVRSVQAMGMTLD